MFKKFLSLLICISFAGTSIVLPPSYAQALMGKDLAPLPAPGRMVALSNKLNPPVLRGIKVFTNDPLNFNFILDPGDKDRAAILNGKINPEIQAQLKETTNRLLKYFLTTLTVPDDEIWVNLSPYEKDRIISEKFGQTEMGRDLLGQDYLLKQITASLMFPEGEAGKKFWARVYEEAQKKFGSTQIPVNTFNKVWIMPNKAVIYEKLSGNQATAFVIESSLKVMLESDYIAQKGREAAAMGAVQTAPLTDTQKLSRNIAREIIIPMLEKEVNEGANFAPLRQVYNSILLALWYKKRMTGSILSSAYVNRDKVAGVNIKDKDAAQKIWQQYVKAYKKGVFNIISEEKDTANNEMMPRKYFAGGFNIRGVTQAMVVKTRLPKMFLGLAVSANFLLVGCGGSMVHPPQPIVPTIINIPYSSANNNSGSTISIYPNGVIGLKVQSDSPSWNSYTFNPTSTAENIQQVTYVQNEPEQTNTYPIASPQGQTDLNTMKGDLEKDLTLNLVPQPNIALVGNAIASLVAAETPSTVINITNPLPSPANYGFKVTVNQNNDQQVYVQLPGSSAHNIYTYDATNNNVVFTSYTDGYESAEIVPVVSTDGQNILANMLYYLGQAWVLDYNTEYDREAVLTPMMQAISKLLPTSQQTVNFNIIGGPINGSSNSYNVIIAPGPNGNFVGIEAYNAPAGPNLYYLFDPSNGTVGNFTYNVGNNTTTAANTNLIATPTALPSLTAIGSILQSLVNAGKVPAGDLPAVNQSISQITSAETLLSQAQPNAKNSSNVAQEPVNGGIDLTRSSTPLDVRNQGGAIFFKINPVQMEHLNLSPGLMPQVFTIEPLKNLPEFLGMNKEEIRQSMTGI